MIMRNTKDNIINVGLTTLIIPFYFIGIFLKWIISQFIDLISMIFNSFKSQLAKFIGGSILMILISSFFNS